MMLLVIVKSLKVAQAPDCERGVSMKAKPACEAGQTFSKRLPSINTRRPLLNSIRFFTIHCVPEKDGSLDFHDSGLLKRLRRISMSAGIRPLMVGIAPPK